MKYLILSLLISAFSYGQSLKDLVEQVGGIPQGQIDEMQQKSGEDTPEDIKTELPATTIIELDSPEAADPEALMYGYDYFSSRKELSFFDNLPAPANYLLGPGDEIIVTIWGKTELREKSTISRDGSIYFENVGQVNVAGLSFQKSEKVLKARFQNVYSTLRGGTKAGAYMEVSLGALKSINVHFLGEVNSPGIMPIHPFSTVTTGLLQAGGVSGIGSLRDIRIIRDGAELTKLDLYGYLQSGSIGSDIRLVDNDIISVPVRNSNIQIEGKVRKPGVFELIEGETLDDLIRFAGGLHHDAGTRVEINRILPPEYRNKNQENVTTIWIDLAEGTDIPLIDGDKVNILPLFASERIVEVRGEVKNPGSFSLAEEMNLRDLLELAGGIFTQDQWQKVYPLRADLIRPNKVTSTSEIIPIKLDKLKAGDEKENITLQDGDRLIIYPANINTFAKVVHIYGDVRQPGEYGLDENMGLTDLILRAGGFTFSAYPAEVVVNSVDPFNISSSKLSTELKVRVEPSIFSSYLELGDYKLKNMDQIFVRRHPDFQVQRNITLEGEVKFPGIYALEKKGETLKNVIDRAGGFSDEAFMEGLRIMRNEKRLILERKGANKVDLKLALQPGDHILIPKHANTVEVLGEVNSPGLIQYRRGLSMSDYVDIAGSFTLDADPSTIAVYYPNGESNSRFLMFDPKVREGSVIVVYKKPAELPLDKTSYLTEITTVFIQALSLILVAVKLAG